METIGRLTGGIAHDFNNLLTVVSGNAELLHDEASDDRVARRASAIRRAANQGERLTRQLLAFSRHQMLRPEPVDLRERTHEISEMLSRSLREDIEVSVEIPQDLWPVVVDLAEFELALLNLGVNARDAMPKGADSASPRATSHSPATIAELRGWSAISLPSRFRTPELE